ncbi:MAG TPA: VCBS repeat-containing protein [Tepidisphaeraceae bacterium]|nr:VCBS repeat-containing protein [Tepidisphaeraceae bacterium]
MQSTASAQQVVTETFNSGLGLFDFSIRNAAGGNDFGYSNTNWAGGAAGEVGGTFARSHPDAYLGASLGGTLPGSSAFTLGANLRLTNTNASGAFFLGYFGRGNTGGDVSALTGLEIAEPETASGAFRVFGRVNGARTSSTPLTTIVQNGATTIDLSYTNGTFTGTIGGSTVNFGGSAGGTFDTFGIGTGLVGSSASTATATGYFDNLRFTKPAATPPPPPPPAATTWNRHIIHNGSKLGNGLHPADINGDGLADYVINFEDVGDIRLIVHPGVNSPQMKQEWQSFNVARFRTAESSTFGDLDGDGFPDVAVAHGHQDPGDVAGVSLVWHPGNYAEATTAAKWTVSNPIPESVELGNYLFIRPADINGDGALDLVAGGRRQGLATNTNPSPSDPIVGLVWLEAPANKTDRRDMTKWKVHDIDTDLISGHGFDTGDLNKDGRLDVAVANADWGDVQADRAVQWYPNPADPTARTQEWERRELYRNSNFYTKPGLSIGDVDGDGWNDMVSQLDDKVLLFRNLGGADGGTPSFERIEITKPAYAQWRSRPIEIVDLNGDGKMDIVSGAIHHDGLMPTDKAALFWMEFTGDTPGADNWTTHVIKWGDTDQHFNNIWTGEKWDNLTFADVDLDGDLDLVANVEEYEPYSIAWFENPGGSLVPEPGILGIVGAWACLTLRRRSAIAPGR